MKAMKNTVVTLNYALYNADNELVDQSDEPISYLHGGYDGIFPKVEEALHEQEVGVSLDITLDPDDAFGELEDELIRIESLADLPEGIEVDTVLEADDPDSGELLLFRITDIADGKAVLDGNHPFAGQRLRFSCTITDIRTATAEEINHGHVHGAGGHHH